MGNPWGNNVDLLTKVEAVEFLKTGKLSEDFKERLENFVEFYECSNCSGVEDMSLVFRAWDDDPSPCPFCVVDPAKWMEKKGFEFVVEEPIMVTPSGWKRKES